MPHLDVTPENTNAWSCPICGAEPGQACFYSTNPPIVRDRMHLGRGQLALQGLADRVLSVVSCATPTGKVAVEVRATTRPDGHRGVLLQLPDGWIVVTAESAREVAGRLWAAADEVDEDA